MDLWRNAKAFKFSLSALSARRVLQPPSKSIKEKKKMEAASTSEKNQDNLKDVIY